MKRLIACVGFLGLLACSEATSEAGGQTPDLTKYLTKDQPQTTIVTTELVVSGWTIDKAKSTIVFSGIQSGEAFSGVFENFDAVIKFDPADLANAHVIVTIDMKSADVGAAEGNDALPGKEWFHVKKFPVAKFEAAHFKHLEGDKYQANGNLTIRAITQPAPLPFTLKIENGSAVMDARLVVNRSIYKIGTGMWASKDWVEHDITVNIHLQARKK